jgi:hypothetical protein
VFWQGWHRKKWTGREQRDCSGEKEVDRQGIDRLQWREGSGQAGSRQTAAKRRKWTGRE